MSSDPATTTSPETHTMHEIGSDPEAVISPNPAAAGHEMTRLLQDWHGGDNEALDRLMPMVVGELRRMANGHFAKEAPGHTLQPTALVNEVYMKLVGAGGVDWQCRAQFFGIAAKLMRRVLVDYARARGRGKRGGDARHTTLDLDHISPEEDGISLIALDDALKEMQRHNPEGCKIVEMRYFTGLTLEEIAEIQGVSRSTAKRKWRTAKLWLLDALQPEDWPSE